MDDSANHYYYTATEKFLTDHNLQFKPRLIDFTEIEKGALIALANNLLQYRKSVNLSQAKMAKILNISFSQYKKYELGIEVLRVDLAQKWSLRFSMPFFHLLQGSGYAEYLTDGNSDSRLNFIWFVANSLTDKYFSKLIDVLTPFIQKPNSEKSLDPFRVTRDDLKKVNEEIENRMYIAIAYGMQAIRKFFDFKQEHIAELMGVSLSTYQQYEKPVMNPRFNIFIAARYGMATGITPLASVAGTHYAKVRNMQNARMALIRELVANIDPNLLTRLKPLVTGFADMAKQTPGALIIDT